MTKPVRMGGVTVTRPEKIAERCPDGMRGQCFFQKNFSDGLATGVRTEPIAAETAGRIVHYVIGGSKKTRRRVFADAFRNAFGQTIVAPYCVRRRPKAPVSTPLDWDEVDPRLDPASTTSGRSSGGSTGRTPGRISGCSANGSPSDGRSSGRQASALPAGFGNGHPNAGRRQRDVATPSSQIDERYSADVLARRG